MNEVEELVDSLINESQINVIKEHSKSLLENLTNACSNLSDAKFSILLINTLKAINQRIVELEDSITGRGGRSTFKVRNIIKELNNILVEIYNEYSPFLKDYEGYIKFNNKKSENTESSRDFILINGQYDDSLDSILYPLSISSDKIEISIEAIKGFLKSSINNPNQFDFGKYHLNEYYNKLQKTLLNIQSALDNNVDYYERLEKLEAQTADDETFTQYLPAIDGDIIIPDPHTLETENYSGFESSIKEELISSLLNVDFEINELTHHKYSIVSLIGYLESTYYALLQSNKVVDNKDNLPTEQENNPYPHIFTNTNAYLVFKRFTLNITPKTQLADFSFIYRIMQKEGYITSNLRESDYRRWLDDEFEIVIDKTKGLVNCSTPHKEHSYSLIKELFQLT